MSGLFGFPRACRRARSMAKMGFRAAAVALAFACLVPIASARDQAAQDQEVRNIRSLNLTEKKALAARLQGEFRRVLDKMKPFPGQAAYTPVKAKFKTEPHNEVLVIDLGAANGPFSTSADMYELGKALVEPATVILDAAGISHPAFHFQFGGRDSDYYETEERLQKKPPPQPDNVGAAIPPEGARVVVSAMHGYYWRVGDKVWKLQRPTRSNGIYEDLITPEFVAPLGNYLAARSGATVHLPRSRSQEAHPSAGYPWWQMAGRYYLKDLYPDNPEIWHSLSEPKPNRYNLWHYDEDINSRPNFANHINADALISIHTNASENPSTNGARAYVTLNRPYDLKMANNILCGMKELVHAKEAYKNYNIPSQADEGNYGENTKANMPAVVLEVGFHTNAGDAAALKDPAFRDAAMKGVEKGFRLHAKGKTCEPFKIASIPNVSGPQGVNIPAKIHYKGYPLFPVKRQTKIVSCAAGWSCSDYNGTYTSNTPSPLTFNFRCTNSSPEPTATFRWRTTLTDADGVVTNAVEHTSTCTTPAAGSALSNHGLGEPTISIVP